MFNNVKIYQSPRHMRAVSQTELIKNNKMYTSPSQKEPYFSQSFANKFINSPIAKQNVPDRLITIANLQYHSQQTQKKDVKNHNYQTLSPQMVRMFELIQQQSETIHLESARNRTLKPENQVLMASQLQNAQPIKQHPTQVHPIQNKKINISPEKVNIQMVSFEEIDKNFQLKINQLEQTIFNQQIEIDMLRRGFDGKFQDLYNDYQELEAKLRQVNQKAQSLTQEKRILQEQLQEQRLQLESNDVYDLQMREMEDSNRQLKFDLQLQSAELQKVQQLLYEKGYECDTARQIIKERDEQIRVLQQSLQKSENRARLLLSQDAKANYLATEADTWKNKFLELNERFQNSVALQKLSNLSQVSKDDDSDKTRNKVKTQMIFSSSQGFASTSKDSSTLIQPRRD